MQESFGKLNKRLKKLEKEAAKLSSRMIEIHHAWENTYTEIKAVYPQKWIKNCDDKKISTSYNFSDVIA